MKKWLKFAYMDVGSTIPWMESVESSREQRPRATQDAYMARVVPNNPLAFPPSMEVSVSGTTTWTWEVELRQEQQPRTTQEDKVEQLPTGRR